MIVPVTLDFLYLQKVRNMALEDVVILNVDTNTLETPFDDLQSLPNDVVGNVCEFCLLSAFSVKWGDIVGLVCCRVMVVDTVQRCYQKSPYNVDFLEMANYKMPSE